MTESLVPVSLAAPTPPPCVSSDAAARTNAERLRQQLLRYETLFALLDDLRKQDDLASVAALVAPRWKYLANIGGWRLVLPREAGCAVVDGARGQAQVYELEALAPWDQHHWAARRPNLLTAGDLQGSPPPPPHLAGGTLGECLVIPFEHQGQCVGLLSLGSKDGPFSALDHKFIRLFGGQLVDHLSLLRMRHLELLRLQSLARRDALTGALNRAGIVETAASMLALARRTGQPVSVLMADVDHFKAVNDIHGHPAGDAVLCEVVSRLAVLTREGEQFGRFGGEEFVFVLYPCTAESAIKAAERMRLGIASRPFDLATGSGPPLPVTVSLGVASSEDWPGAGFNDLIGRADEALYAAKHAGRNRVWRSRPEPGPDANSQ